MRTRAKNTRTTRSLATLLALAFFSVSVFVLLLSSSLQIALNVQAQQSAIQTRQLLIAQDAGKEVSNFIEDKYNILETVVGITDPFAQSAVEQKTFIQSILGIKPSFSQLALINGQGRRVIELSRLSETISPQFTIHLGDNEILSSVSKGGRYLSSVYIDDDTSEPRIVISIPVKDILGNFEGALVAEVNLKFMWDLVDQIKVGEAGYAYVVDAQGNLLAFRDSGLVLQSANVKQIAEVSEFLKDPSAPVDTFSAPTRYSGLGGAIVIGSYAPLGTPPWAVVVELPWNEAYRDVILLIERTLASILGIAIVASLIGVVVARRLAAPIVELSGVASEIAKGNLNVQAGGTGTNEIVWLSDSFNGMITQLRDLIGNLERRVAQRTSELEVVNRQSSRRVTQLQAITKLSEEIAQVRDLNELFNIITHLISELFGFYHVGIFIVDSEKEYAVLQATNSEGGQRMLTRAHRLKLGTGVVGYSAQTGLSRIALDVGNDAVFFDNPDLPQTRSEAALPLKARGETIGVLDVQSTEPNAFSIEDLQVLNALANQVSISFENIRLLTETRAALAQAEEVYNEFTRTEWSRAVAQSDQTGFRYQAGRIEMVEGSLESPEAVLAMTTGSVAMKHAQGITGRRPTVAVPVMLRGEIIGVLQIEADDPSREWQEEDVSLVQSVAERAAFALENARLFQDARRRASKEQMISESTSRISGALNIENILRTTAQELERVLGGSEVLIRFRQDQDKEQ